MNRGLDVLTEWRYRKDQYCKITDTIIYDFAHYSKHDSSHSVSILETIELVIGDERIVKLSRGIYGFYWNLRIPTTSEWH